MDVRERTLSYIMAIKFVVILKSIFWLSILSIIGSQYVQLLTPFNSLILDTILGGIMVGSLMVWGTVLLLGLGLIAIRFLNGQRLLSYTPKD